MLRTIASFLILTILSFSVFAQEATKVKKNKLKNLYVAPSAGIEFMSIKKYDSENNGFYVVYKGVPSVRLGADVDYKQSEKLTVHTGLFFSAKNFNRTETNKEGNSAYFYDQKFKNHYVETLIGAAYNFVSGRVDLGAYGNLNFGYLLTSTETRLTETGNKFINNTKPGFNKLLGNFEPGFKLNYNINYRLSFGIKTGYRLYFNSISIDKKFNNNGVLVQTGLFYKF